MISHAFHKSRLFGEVVWWSHFMCFAGTCSFLPLLFCSSILQLIVITQCIKRGGMQRCGGLCLRFRFCSRQTSPIPASLPVAWSSSFWSGLCFRCYSLLQRFSFFYFTFSFNKSHCLLVLATSHVESTTHMKEGCPKIECGVGSIMLWGYFFSAW